MAWAAIMAEKDPGAKAPPLLGDEGWKAGGEPAAPLLTVVRRWKAWLWEAILMIGSWWNRGKS